MNRHEIIAAIDAEIERLQRARLLIVQSAVGKRSDGSHKRRAQTANVGRKLPFAPDRGSTAPLHPVGPTQTKEKPRILVTRMPPKEPPKRRVVRAVMIQSSALTGDVPQGPVVVAAKSRELAPEANNKTAAPTSAFGLAIARGLASLGGGKTVQHPQER